MVLSGRSLALARARGARRVLVSLTHDGEYALAQVMLLGEAPAAPPPDAAP
jgi:phosphopantetheinyl transferase (holo-ACP synthase)